MRGPITDAVAEVLTEHDAHAARTILAEAMLAATGTEMATRVRVRRDHPAAVLRIHGHGYRPAAEELPSAADIRRHPLYRYLTRSGDRRPTRLEDAVRAGWPLDEATRRIIESLRITTHQLALTVPTRAEYDGWSLLAPSPITRLQLQPIAEHARLLGGLDAHVELLAQIQACTGPSDAAGARLTPRELTVLHLVHAGGTAASIGARLGVSPRTIHKHQENLYRKLGARDRLGAVLAAQRSGLLPAPPAE